MAIEMSDDLLANRDAVLDYLKRELVGPRGGEYEELGEEPHRRYMAGILYPQESDFDAMVTEEETDATGVVGESGPSDSVENQGDDPIALASQFLPSSMGISFYLQGEPDVDVEVLGGRYDEVAGPSGRYGSRKWKRKPLERGPIRLEPDPSMEGRVARVEREILNGEARIHSVWRSRNQGWLVTISLVNEIKHDGQGLPPGADCLCQAGLRCRVPEGSRISAYPRPKLLTDDLEEEILELLYRDSLAFGVGHGCSVGWGESIQDSVREIWTETIPAYEVPPLIYDVSGAGDVLSLPYLVRAAEEDPGDLVQSLNRFVDGYGEWIIGLEARLDDVPATLGDAARAVVDRLWRAEDRMRQGIALLQDDAIVRSAFGLANRAMLMQWVHGTDDRAGKRKSAREVVYTEPELSGEWTWRPFQLAFQLLTLPSVADCQHPDRKVVDLIWFPTGGGKTEAYLAVAAFHIFHRRLTSRSSGAGTTVIMRYTLRLLTAQQFKRASRLICACERLRRRRETLLGDEEISIGLWVGQDAAPNRCEKAYKQYLEMRDQREPESPFQIEWCPWCGTELAPAKRSSDDSLYGIRSTTDRFELFCPNETCPFHERLPIQVVDEELYRRPPTLLLATVDKFARLPWVERAGAFFGGDDRRPPELIIQDELHLIAGPLGTIVGVYEMAIDSLASWEGRPPKILASTATIRRADEQCRALYARPVELFPAKGLKASDSYFARFDFERPGRLYVGVMGQGHTGSTNMIRTSAALLQAPVDLGLEGESLDAYWTLVAYHNSLRELGKTLNFGADDIPARLKVIARDQAARRELDTGNVKELTSRVKGSSLGRMLERLERRQWEDGAISLLVCTNMLSVGVDVQRLGLMLVNGQPKSTSEYIQATSRVGRGRVPGLVVCLYAPTKPRDRSHYEQFEDYHQAMYRYVEPSSVTPFAVPARNRALHAVLVTLVRHGIGLAGDVDAGLFDSQLEELERVRDLIIRRAREVDPREEASTKEQIEELIKEWEEWATTYQTLRYDGYNRQQKAVLRSAGRDYTQGWDTLHSMRNVDRECVIHVMKGV